MQASCIEISSFLIEEVKSFLFTSVAHTINFASNTGVFGDFFYKLFNYQFHLFFPPYNLLFLRKIDKPLHLYHHQNRFRGVLRIRIVCNKVFLVCVLSFVPPDDCNFPADCTYSKYVACAFVVNEMG